MTEKKHVKNQSSLIKDFNLISLGWELALPIFGGALSGYLLDRAFTASPCYVIGLTILGIFVGYYSLYRHIELEHLRLKVAKKNAASERKPS